MTPQQALQIVDQAVASLRVSRADHAALVQALQVLAGLVPKEVGLAPSTGTSAHQ